MGSYFSKDKLTDTNNKITKQEPPKVDTGDQAAVKNLLDDELIYYLKEIDNYKFDYTVDNIKIFLMLLACGVAALSHFYKLKGPYSNIFIYSCVITFFIINGILNVIAYWYYGDAIGIVFSKQGSLNKQKFRVLTEFPKYEDSFKIGFSFKSKYISHIDKEKKDKNVSSKKKKEKTKDTTTNLDRLDIYVGKIFDKNGYFDRQAYQNEIKSFIKTFDNAKKI